MRSYTRSSSIFALFWSVVLVQPSIVLGQLQTILRGGQGVEEQTCKDPLGAVLKTLKCVEEERLFCAVGGYNPDFVKYHNGVDTQTPVGIFFWAGGFYLADFKIDIEETEVISKNQVRVQYVETVTTLKNPNDEEAGYPFNTRFFQNEDALVTVDRSCRIKIWDQTGPIEEQTDLDEALVEVMKGLLEPVPQFILDPMFFVFQAFNFGP